MAEMAFCGQLGRWSYSLVPRLDYLWVLVHSFVVMNNNLPKGDSLSFKQPYIPV
jgi:hypothetical protein